MRHGFTAISSVIIIGVIMAVLGTAVSLISINFSQSSLSSSQKFSALNDLDSCAQESLLYLNKYNSLPPAVNFPGFTCTVTVNRQVGTSWDFTVSVPGALPQSGRIILDRADNLSVASWQER